MNQKVWLSTLATVLVLTACGSTGSGSGATATTGTTGTTTGTNTGTTAGATTTAGTGSASFAGGQYIYTTVNGAKYNITTPGITSGKLSTLTDSTIGSLSVTGTLAIGGSKYSYSRFGSYATQDNKLDVFATGSATSADKLPTTGVVTYVGGASRVPAYKSSAYSTMNYQVDFGSKKITGTGTPETGFGDALALDGAVSGATFSGTAKTGSATGTFSGGFYGPVGEELAGTAKFSDIKLNSAFGGQKQ